MVEVALETHDLEHVAVGNAAQGESRVLDDIEDVLEHTRGPVEDFLNGDHLLVVEFVRTEFRQLVFEDEHDVLPEG